MYHPECDLAEVETCRRNTSNKLLFIIDCAICWIKYCTMSDVWRYTVIVNLAAEVAE